MCLPSIRRDRGDKGNVFSSRDRDAVFNRDRESALDVEEIGDTRVNVVQAYDENKLSFLAMWELLSVLGSNVLTRRDTHSSTSVR